jgi:hypothetical protein
LTADFASVVVLAKAIMLLKIQTFSMKINSKRLSIEIGINYSTTSLHA